MTEESNKTKWQLEEIIKRLDRMEKKFDELKQDFVTQEEFEGAKKLAESQHEAMNKECEDMKDTQTWLIRGVVIAGIMTIILSIVGGVISTTIFS